MKRILVIEDETAIRETLAEILQMRDYEVIKAENGKVGYNKAVDLYPDLVICDMMMPEMDGKDTIEAFRNHTALKFIPFIFLSALSELSDLRKGMNLGAEDYLTKPFQTKELLSVIDLQFQKIKENRELSDALSEHRIEKAVVEIKQKAAVNEQKWLDYLQSAANIQSLILPKTTDINKLFPENFMYYRPKYSVSGDFYWAQDFGDTKLIAVADCTGHGISASLLTICCYNGLNLAVQHYGLENPKDILEKVNELVLTFMCEQGKSHNEVGMDILICAVNEKEKTLTYAGANRPLYIITEDLKISSTDAEVKEYSQKQGNSLFKIRGSHFTVGSTNKKSTLSEHTITYNSGDLIYLSSDGYSDQFGGPSDKCFKSYNLIQLLISTQKESLEEQMHIVAENFSLWKGATEQTDDVTLMGIGL
jgi:DNA-binding response OmpR family regulator